MHELSITKDLIRMIEQECSDKKIAAPKRIVAELGSMASFKKDPIIFYFDLLKKENALLSKTELEIAEVTAKAYCARCRKTSMIDQPYLVFCGHCDSYDVKITEGRDFILKRIISD